MSFYQSIADKIGSDGDRQNPTYYLKRFIAKSLDFTGVDNRPQFWWPTLFLCIYSFALGMINSAVAQSVNGGGIALVINVLIIIANLIFLPTTIAGLTRRYRDAGLPPLLLLLFFIPFIGIFIIYLIAIKSSAHNHKVASQRESDSPYGEEPEYPTA